MLRSALRLKPEYKETATIVHNMLEAVKRGEIIIPPCSIGTDVFFVEHGKTMSAPITKFEINQNGAYFELQHRTIKKCSVGLIGKNYFFDRESLNQSCKKYSDEIIEALKAQSNYK